jgi:hypothetical protein
MGLDHQSLFGIHVLCTVATPPPIPPHFGSYTRMLLVSQERRHLLVSLVAQVVSHTCYDSWCGGGVAGPKKDDIKNGGPLH